MNFDEINRGLMMIQNRLKRTWVLGVWTGFFVFSNQTFAHEKTNLALKGCSANQTITEFMNCAGRNVMDSPNDSQDSIERYIQYLCMGNEYNASREYPEVKNSEAMVSNVRSCMDQGFLFTDKHNEIPKRSNKNSSYLSYKVGIAETLCTSSLSVKNDPIAKNECFENAVSLISAKNLYKEFRPQEQKCKTEAEEAFHKQGGKFPYDKVNGPYGPKEMKYTDAKWQWRRYKENFSLWEGGNAEGNRKAQAALKTIEGLKTSCLQKAFSNLQYSTQEATGEFEDVFGCLEDVESELSGNHLPATVFPAQSGRSYFDRGGTILKSLMLPAQIQGKPAIRLFTRNQHVMVPLPNFSDAKGSFLRDEKNVKRFILSIPNPYEQSRGFRPQLFLKVDMNSEGKIVRSFEDEYIEDEKQAQIIDASSNSKSFIDPSVRKVLDQALEQSFAGVAPAKGGDKYARRTNRLLAHSLEKNSCAFFDYQKARTAIWTKRDQLRALGADPSEKLKGGGVGGKIQ